MTIQPALAAPFILLSMLIAAPIDGTWTGSLPAPGKPLRLVFHLKNAGGTVDSPDQNATGIAISGVEVTGSSVRIKVASISGTFFGTIKPGNEIAGVWKQGAALPLTLKRSSGSPSTAEGKWEGVLQTPQGRLRLIFNIKKSGKGYTGTTDSPDQNANGISLTAVALKNGSLNISCAAIHGEFSGKLSKDGKSASGELWQGVTYPLTLKRSR